jgi:hypothetical protein
MADQLCKPGWLNQKTPGWFDLWKGCLMRAEVLGRIMLALGELILVLTFSLHAFSRDLSIFSVQKSLPLDPKEPVYHDYYIDGGSDEGLQIGQLVTVVRRIPMHDVTRNKPLGDMHLPVAKLKIIYAQRGSSVARVVSLYSDQKRPIVDYNSVMVGDKVQGFTGDDDGENAGPQEGEKKEEPAKTEAVELKAPAPEHAANEPEHGDFSSKLPENKAPSNPPSKSEKPVVPSPTT